MPRNLLFLYQNPSCLILLRVKFRKRVAHSYSVAKIVTPIINNGIPPGPGSQPVRIEDTTNNTPTTKTTGLRMCDGSLNQACLALFTSVLYQATVVSGETKNYTSHPSSAGILVWAVCLVWFGLFLWANRLSLLKLYFPGLDKAVHLRQPC